MKYMCLIYYDEKNLDSLSKKEFETLVDEALDYDVDLQEKGQSLAVVHCNRFKQLPASAFEMVKPQSLMVHL